MATPRRTKSSIFNATTPERQAIECLRQLSRGTEKERELSGDYTSPITKKPKLATEEIPEVKSGKSVPKTDTLWHVSKIIVSDYVYNLLKPDRIIGCSLVKLKPHAFVTWTSSTRPTLAQDTHPAAISTYYREWCVATKRHPDYANATKQEEKSPVNKRTLLIHSPPGTGLLEVSLDACRDFSKKFQASKLIDIENHEEKLDNNFSEAAAQFHPQKLHPESSTLSNTLKTLELKEFTAKLRQIHVNKFVLSSTKRKGDSVSQSPLHSPSETEFHMTMQTNSGEMPLNLYIPLSQKKFFTFEDEELFYLNFPVHENTESMKTPVIFIGSSGADKGLYAQNYSTSEQTTPRMIICRDIEKESYMKHWPDHIIIAISEKFDEFGLGSLKASAQHIASHFHRQATNNQIDGRDLWPYCLLIEDTSVQFKKDRIDVTFDDFLSEAEAQIKAVKSAGLIGFQNVENSVSSLFSKAIILNLVALAEKGLFFNYQKFMSEDEDFLLRVKSYGLLTLKLNNLTIQHKKLKKPLRDITPLYNDSQEVIPVEKYISRVEKVDITMHKPAQASYLFEKFFKEHAKMIFDKYIVRNPVLCIKNYIDLGKNFIVEYANPETNEKWAKGNETLTYSGFMLSLVDDGKTQLNKAKYARFFKKFKFIKGACGVIAGLSRNQLRRQVKLLDLHKEWNFPDEFQTSTKENSIFYLRGILK